MESQPVEQKSSREFKDTFFRALFHEEERALELCNAVEDTDFPSGTPIKFYSRGDTSLTRRNVALVSRPPRNAKSQYAIAISAKCSRNPVYLVGG